MATAPNSNGFPGGSKSRVNRAGAAVRAGSATSEDLHVIDEWRAAHRHVLNTFQAILRNRTRGTTVTVAQRHKRKRTIFDKLRRLPQMQLSRMDDIAGCRLIFKRVNELYKFRKAFLKARFNHKRRNEIGKYDYIKAPKPTGYRGVHDVYEYDVRSEVGRRLTGLYVEIQLRALFELERALPDRDIVLVRADTTDEVRLAFKNYFSDARDFIRMIEMGCAKLASVGTIAIPRPSKRGSKSR
jgi:putative GTP pyrophosphokinase